MEGKWVKWVMPGGVAHGVPFWQVCWWCALERDV